MGDLIIYTLETIYKSQSDISSLRKALGKTNFWTKVGYVYVCYSLMVIADNVQKQNKKIANLEKRVKELENPKGE